MSSAELNPDGLPDRLVGSIGPQRVLIVEDDTLVSVGLKAQLERLGHVVVEQARNREDAALYFRKLQPDLVLLDVSLTKDPSDTQGLELARAFFAERPVPIVVLSAFSEPTLVSRAGEAGIFGYLVKPVNLQSLQAQIQVAVMRFADAKKLRLENERLLRALETRKVLERAKGILMRRSQLDEPTAHRQLQQESQKRRISLAELAKQIVESDEPGTPKKE